MSAPMLWVRCPKCKQVAAQKVPMRGAAPQTDYFECDDCGHVWSAPQTSATKP